MSIGCATEVPHITHRCIKEVGMKTVTPLPSGIPELVDAWSRPQQSLREVPRWKKYVKRGTRPQDTLQHSYSFALFAVYIFARLRTHLEFDENFVLRAVLLHDLGEGEIKVDTLYIDKNHDADIAECDAFLHRFGNSFGKDGREAFLLQFAVKANRMASYEKELCEILRRRPVEVLVFEAIERFDYLLYALEQWIKRGKVKILVQVLRNQAPHLSRLCAVLPDLREVLWTTDLEKWSDAFLDLHQDKWIEQKGEK